jgi:microcystin-dependent protein
MATTDYIKQGEVIRAADIVAAFDEKADKSYVDNNKAPINYAPSGTTASNTIPANSSNPITTILQTIINNLRWIFNNNLRNIANVIYPVGAIYMSVSSTSPGTLFGGTWVAWGMGRTIIGMGQSTGVTTSTGTIDNRNFNTVEATAGNYTHTLITAEMPSHNHTFTGAVHHHRTPPLYGNGASVGAAITNLYGSESYGASGQVYGASSDSYAKLVPFTENIAAGGTIGNTPANAATGHNNLPPYITCYMWKRTA